MVRSTLVQSILHSFAETRVGRAWGMKFFLISSIRAMHFVDPSHQRHQARIVCTCSAALRSWFFLYIQPITRHTSDSSIEQ